MYDPADNILSHLVPLAICILELAFDFYLYHMYVLLKSLKKDPLMFIMDYFDLVKQSLQVSISLEILHPRDCSINDIAKQLSHKNTIR